MTKMRDVAVRYALMAFCIALFSCSYGERGKNAECEKLFSLKYGKSLREIDLADIAQDIGAVHTVHTMQDGFFFVASEGKLMEINSYGSLMYACISANFDEDEGEEGSDAQRKMKYPIIDATSIAVDKQKRVYVACAMPEDEKDTGENGQVYSWVVLRITKDAAEDDYIGRQGAGGSPFPYIKSVNMTADDELVVVCEGEDGVEAWCFSREGKPTGYVTVPRMMNLGASGQEGKEGDSRSMAVTRDVLAARQSRTLLVCADCYEGQEYSRTYVIKVDIASGDGSDSVEIPPYERIVSEDFGKVSYKMPYDFLGVADSGDMFFVIATDDGFALQVVSSDGRRITRRNLAAGRKASLYHSLSVSDTGIVSAMMAQENDAAFMWWRTDTIGG